MINVDFSVDIWRINLWGQRMGVDIRCPGHLTKPYTLAQNHLLRMADLLADFHGFQSFEPSDNRMLFALGLHDAAAQGVRTLMHHQRAIELPIHSTSFFSPQRRDQWERIFHSPLWNKLGRGVPVSNTVADLLNFLQCLLPGMLLIVEVGDGWSTQRGIPPLHWVRENKEILVASIGLHRVDALLKAASDIRQAVIDSRDVLMDG